MRTRTGAILGSDPWTISVRDSTYSATDRTVIESVAVTCYGCVCSRIRIATTAITSRSLTRCLNTTSSCERIKMIVRSLQATKQSSHMCSVCLVQYCTGTKVNSNVPHLAHAHLIGPWDFRLFDLRNHALNNFDSGGWTRRVRNRRHVNEILERVHVTSLPVGGPFVSTITDDESA